MSTGIVILNYNSFEETLQCIQSVEEKNSATIKYIVVDNGSTNKDAVSRIHDFLQERFGEQYQRIVGNRYPDHLTKVNFIVSPTNDGYAQGNNKGLILAFTDSEIEDILILNNDVIFESDILPTLLSVRETLSSPAFLTPLLRNPYGDIEFSCARTLPSNWAVILPFLLFKKDLFHILSWSSRRQKLLLTDPSLLNQPSFPIGMPSGAFMFVSKSLFEQLGGFDPGTFLYYEENILCRLLQDKGLVNYCVPTVHAIHVGGASTSRTNNLFLQKCNLESADYYLRRFSQLTIPQSIIWWITLRLWKLKFRIKESIQS